MPSPKRKSEYFKALSFLGLGIVLALGVVAPAFAAPAPSFSPPSCTEPPCTTFTALFTYGIDSACVSGGFYSLTGETTTLPDGTVETAPSNALGTWNCGVIGFAQPFGDFTNHGAPPPACGTYTFEFVGDTYNAAGGPVPFDVTVHYVVSCPTGAPEFPLGIALLFAIMVPAMLVLRKRILAPGLLAH